MLKFGQKIVKYRIVIFILGLFLLIPSVIGYVMTRVNYDILTYLPDEIDTMKGQDILKDEFGTGAYSMFICEGMKDYEVSDLKEKIEEVENVENVIWYDTLADVSVPMEILPDDIYEAFNSDDSTMMFIIFETGTSEDATMDAIREIRSIAGEQCFLSGMSAIVTDTRDLCDSEVPLYVAIAVILSAIVLAVTMDSFFVPVILLLSIGMAIIYNQGSNIFFGETSYITKALSAVLQLGVTTDYSIFLWHSYEEMQERWPGDKKNAMAHAIAATLQSVIGSSVTTVAGFIALCFMSFTLGLDLGLVMAKGVLLGVVCCVTVLPSMVLIFDKLLEKTKHKNFIPEAPKITDFVLKHTKVFVALLVILVIPAYWCNTQTSVYYNLDSSLPDYLPSIQANTAMQEDFDTGATHIVLVNSSLSTKEVKAMMDEIEAVDGINAVLGLESVVGSSIPEEMIPSDAKEIFENKNWEMLLILNKYATASDEVNAQITELNAILDRYDPTAMLVGEAPCTSDLITITDQDFKTVNAVSIVLVFLIILFVFRSPVLPFILVAVIEFAIFINLGIPYLTGTTLPFVASIVIGTIQLGATVDYAILMTGRYLSERYSGKEKKEAVWIAHRTSFRSVIVSALSFFAATFGVGMYSGIDMISSLCLLMARGALISMAVVLLVLPSMLIVFDPIIVPKKKLKKLAAKNAVEVR